MARPETPCSRPVRDALIAFMAAPSQAQAEATKAAQRAGIEHAMRNDERAYLGRKPSFTREQFEKVRSMLANRPWASLRSSRRLA
jgi:putative DNA-invertase from lambdoid prophage Rac